MKQPLKFSFKYLCACSTFLLFTFVFCIGLAQTSDNSDSTKTIQVEPLPLISCWDMNNVDFENITSENQINGFDCGSELSVKDVGNLYTNIDTYVGFGGFYDLISFQRFGVRVIIGVENLHYINNLGVRLSVDYSRHSKFEAGTVAIASHITYGIDITDAIDIYGGLGVGYQYIGMASVEAAAAKGAYFGGLIGADYYFTDTQGVFLEVMYDYYLNLQPEVKDNANFIYPLSFPTITVGLKNNFK